jgi:molybdopterin molybdotransferase
MEALSMQFKAVADAAGCDAAHGSSPISVDEALQRLLAQASLVEDIEWVDAHQALHRVLALDQVSSLSVPPHDNSAVDGYAFAVSDTGPAVMAALPVSQRFCAGAAPSPLIPGTAARIFTGAPVPAGADAVVMQEDCHVDGGYVFIRSTVQPGENIRRRGEDIAVGQVLAGRGTRLQPQHLGLMASVGVSRVPVFRRLRVAMMCTGDELVNPGEPLAPGRIYNSNRYTLQGLLQALGCEVIDFGIVRDNPGAMRDALLRAANEADVIITSGGVSVGEEDHVKAAVQELGRLDLWRIAIKPGKPLAFGVIGKTPVLGLPGNPVSLFVTFCILARPFILRSQGVHEVWPYAIPLAALFDRPKSGKRREYIRVRLVQDANGVLGLDLHPYQGSGVLSSAVWADGLAVIKEGRTLKRGEPVEFLPYSELLS